MKTLGKIIGRDAFNRVNFLYQLAVNTLKQNPENVGLVKFYCHSLKSVAQKNVLKLDPSIKRNICKKCNVLLIPGVTATARIRRKREKHTVVKCLECGCIRRYLWRLNSSQQLWCVEPDAWQCRGLSKNNAIKSEIPLKSTPRADS